MMTKIQLRKKYRAVRQSIPITERQKASQAVVSLLMEAPIFSHSQYIACYLPHREEFDTRFIIETIWHTKKNCYLPVIDATRPKSLFFTPYAKNDILQPNSYGILEPASQDNRIVTSQLDLVIVPLLAFDKYGHRLGTGGGFYDYTFSFLSGQKEQKPFLMGLAYAAQQTDLLPTDAWDIPLNAILTENQLTLTCGNQSN